MKTPKVSVIVPNYNHARFLDQRLSSIFAQTFGDFELLFLDDASTDDSRSVFEKYAGDPRVRAIFNSSNGGSTFKQWNRGVREASGEYIWIAESDDYADPRLLAELISQLEQHASCGIAYCQSVEVDDQGNIGRNLQWTTDQLDPTRWERDYTNSGEDECRRFLLIGNTLPNASAVVFRRALYNQVGGADESMKLCGDWLLWTELLAISDLAYVAEPLNFFRQHDATVRSHRSNTLLAILERYKIMESIVRRNMVPVTLLEPACQKMADIWEYHSHLDPASSLGMQWKVYREAVKVDSRITRRLYLKTIQPWLGSIKNRLLKRTAPRR